MLVPYSWLKEYVEIDLSPEDLAQRLTMAGLEVDRVEYPWPNIVTAEIVWLEPIAGSDHLNATRVTTGSEEFSVVCGAPNIKLHDRVPLARVGAKVGEVTILETRKRGVLSQGMLCSPRELGLSNDHSGIYILPPDTPLGVPLGKLLGEAVIELDIKAHRGDLFCMLGIAREVGAFTHKPLRPPTITLEESNAPGERAADLMTIEVRDTDLCPRYTTRLIRGVTLGPSPQWMADRLTAAGMRPINAIVDVTNYVMLELGQPLHAFDYDKVTDHTLIIRRAAPDEELTTLDGVTRQLTPEMLLITDPAGPAVIAGIFGGERVEVSEETTTVLLEAAHFSPTSIRRTSQAVGLRTEASSRFEKNPDIALTTTAIDRAAQLIVELAGGQIAGGRIDTYPYPVAPRAISFQLSQVPWLTGMQVTQTEAVTALTALGFGVQPQQAANGQRRQAATKGDVTLHVTVPTGRGDVEESADLVEEVARIVGYDRIPSILPDGPLPAQAPISWFAREDGLRELLVGAGLTEIISYPLTSRPTLARLLPGDAPDTLLAALATAVPVAALSSARATADSVSGSAQRTVAERLPAITLANPASSEMDTLRLTLMAGLLAAVRENAKHENAGLWFFELGRRYLPTATLRTGDGLADERRTLGAAISGSAAQSWLGDQRPADFYTIKGVAEVLLDALKISVYRFTAAQHPTLHPGRSALLEVRVADEEMAAWQPVGVLGEVHPDVAERFDLPQRTYLLELDLEPLFEAAPEHIVQQAIARYPAAQRDLALVVARDLPEAEVARVILASGAPLVRAARLFDVYTGEGIAREKKSLAYALTYQSAERTLTDQDVERAQAAILDALRSQFGAELRS